ncbi:phospholipase A1 3 isoform X2 [Anopheles arabiensis]|uniref:phospholipase A1 3 isoform X2 n=1 Tax=Anopheles arabiensis TaxID=7173 RepID=UPI001AACF806|nr:phospholipase A1 3 isoform X2 [Anopheles arabiensis]
MRKSFTSLRREELCIFPVTHVARWLAYGLAVLLVAAVAPLAAPVSAAPFDFGISTNFSSSMADFSARQDDLLPFLTADQDDLLANRVGTVIGAFGNTLSQLLFGTNDVSTDVTFWCATTNQPEYVQAYVDDPRITQKLDPSKPIAFLTHGWTDNVNRTWVKQTVADYVRLIGGNICAVDWSPLALVEYNLAARNTPKVGRYLGKFVQFLLTKGFSINQVTLVGHSMGAHISGIAGAYLGGQVPSVIGLDPAGPAFTKPIPVSTDRRLDRTDGRFVQAIHTDKNIIGTTMNLGHQDYYANSGASPQPGCEFPLVNNDTTKAYLQFICSHFKAVEYFRASLDRQNIFEGTACSSYYSYKRNDCSAGTKDDFGLFNNKTASGSLFIAIDKTVYPYARTVARSARK